MMTNIRQHIPLADQFDEKDYYTKITYRKRPRIAHCMVLKPFPKQKTPPNNVITDLDDPAYTIEHAIILTSVKAGTKLMDGMPM